MKIDIASKTDLKELVKLINTCYRSQASHEGWTTEANIMHGFRTTPDILRQEMAQPNVTMLKGTSEGGKIIACVSTIHEGDNLRLDQLCVKPRLQSQGKGKEMIRAVEDMAREANCSKLVVGVIAERKELVWWLERQGFEVTGNSFPLPEPSFETGIPKIPLELVMELEKVVGPS